MPVSGQTPTRIHLVDSPSAKWTAGAAYPDPNDPSKLVRDVEAHVTGEVDVHTSTSVTIDASSNPVIALGDASPAGAISVSLDSTVEDGFIRDIFNESANTATLTPTSGDINDGTGAGSSVTLAAGTSCRLSKTSSGSPAVAHWRMLKGAGTGGGSSPTTTEGDLIVRGSSADQRLGIGSNNQVLTVDTSVSGKVKWANPTSGGGGGAISSGPIASLPSPGTAGDLYLPTDSPYHFYDNGSSWDAFVEPIGKVVPPIAANFTGVNMGSAVISGGSNTPMLLVVPASTSDNLRIQEMAMPATPYTLTVWIKETHSYLDYAWGGICVRDSSSGKIVCFDVTHQVTELLSYDKFNSPTSYNGQTTLWNGVNAYSSILAYRLNDNGTIFTVSVNLGCGWFQIFSISRTDFLSTPDKIGFFGNSRNNQRVMVGIYSWQIT